MAPQPRAGSRFQKLASPSSSPLFAPEARSYAKRGCHDGVRRRPTPQKARNRPPDMTIRSCRVLVLVVSISCCHRHSASLRFRPPHAS